MDKKKLFILICMSSILLIVGISCYQQGCFQNKPEPTAVPTATPPPTTSPTPTPTPSPTISPTLTPTPSPTTSPTPTPTPIVLGYFGVVAQYYKNDEVAAYCPDLWTLVEFIGATHVNGAPRRWVADQAAQHGLKVSFRYTQPVWDPTDPNLPDYWKDETGKAMKRHLDLYNVSQYRNHPGVGYHILTGEPCGNYDFDVYNPDENVQRIIKIIRIGLEYIRSKDPTHPVTVALNPAGAHGYDAGGKWIDKRKKWISYFIDYVDVLDYHLYLFGDAGTEYWRDPELMRTRLVTMLDQVLIPSSQGKPIIIGETGCPTGDFKDWKGEIAKFNEEQQAEYFRIFGEETKKREILVFVYKLIDSPGETSEYGLFKAENDGKMNIPKVAARRVKDYLSISQLHMP